LPIIAVPALYKIGGVDQFEDGPPVKEGRLPAMLVPMLRYGVVFSSEVTESWFLLLETITSDRPSPAR
jgi:hypothetical protein